MPEGAKVPGTRRIYYTDAYRRAFSARVVGLEDGGRRVYLDETAFYPTSGGQPHDTGLLAGVAVIDVVDEDDRIAHILAAPVGEGGAAGADAPGGALVVGELDWPRRLDHMQQHTGQHLLSAVLDDLYGWKTVSVHFGGAESTLDVDAAVAGLTPDRLRAAELRVNEVIAEDRPVRIGFEEAAAAAGLRKPSERAGEIRIVTIDGIDRSACGGTHVRSTGGIGALLVGGAEKVRGHARIAFVCGSRVVRRAHDDRAALERVSSALSVSVAEAPDAAARAAAQLAELQSWQRKAGGELAVLRARAMLAAAEPEATGFRLVVDVRGAADPDELRALAQAMSHQPRALYIGAASEPPFVVLAASEETGMDAGRVLRETLDAEQGRGGGSPRAAQGRLPDQPAVSRVVERLRQIAGSVRPPQER